jgi:hypothetical protein
MNMKTLLLTGVIVCGLLTAVTVDAQTPVVIKGGKLCEKYLLKKVAKDEAEGSRVLRLSAFDRGDKKLPADVRKWLEDVNEETLGAHELRYGHERVLMLNAASRAATGLAVNFHYWYIKTDRVAVEFMSQSENPRLIFWDREGALNYYAVDFSSEFVERKDWGNVTLDLQRYRVSPDGEPQLVAEERNVKCE